MYATVLYPNNAGGEVYAAVLCPNNAGVEVYAAVQGVGGAREEFVEKKYQVFDIIDHLLILVQANNAGVEVYAAVQAGRVGRRSASGEGGTRRCRGYAQMHGVRPNALQSIQPSKALYIPGKAPRILLVRRSLLALVGRKQTVVNDQHFPQEPLGSRRCFSRTWVQHSTGGSTIELPPNLAETNSYIVNASPAL